MKMDLRIHRLPQLRRAPYFLIYLVGYLIKAKNSKRSIKIVLRRQKLMNIMKRVIMTQIGALKTQL